MTVDLNAQVSRAIGLMELRRPEQAAQLLREVLIADATNWNALYQLAWLRWQQSDYAEAATLAERLLMLGPDRIHGYLMLARIRHGEDRNEEAEPYARRALEIDPHLPAAYVVLAKILGELDELGEAWDLAEHALSLAPDYAEPYEVIITVAGRTGGWDRAESFTLEALRQHPQLGLLHAWLGLIRAGQGRPDQARREFMTTLATNPQPSTLDFVAEFMELIGAAATSLADVYQRICQVRGVPDLTVPGAAGTDPDLLAKQAEIAERLYHASFLENGTAEHFQVADGLVGAILAADSGNQLARFVRAQMLRDTREYSAALPIALRLLDEGFERGELRRVIVHCQDELGAGAETVASLARAEALYPADAWFLVFHAQFLFAHGDPAGAESYARRTIELRPDAALPYGILGKSLAQQGELRDAWDAVVAGVALDSEDFGDFTAVAGFVIEPLGLDVAVELAAEAVRAHPGVAPLRVWLAALYTQAGAFDLARSEFDAVLGLEPSAAARELALQCLQLCDDPVELGDVRQAFSAGG